MIPKIEMDFDNVKKDLTHFFIFLQGVDINGKHVTDSHTGI
jgi:hypothetical protein